MNAGMQEISARKIIEISKEEKVARDRLREMRQQISKRLKEVANTGVFAS
jgi:hypothetical protein